MDNAKDSRFYSVLEKIALSFVSQTNLDDILETILVQTKKIIPYSSANIMLNMDGTLRIVHWKGYEKYGADSFVKTFSLDIGNSGKIPHVMYRKKIEVVNDTRSDPEWKVFSQSSYVKSAVIAPLLWDGEVIGILSLDGDKPGIFSEDDAEKLQPLVSFASAAINNAKLLDSAHREIERRKKTEIKLQEAMEVQQILLREINHRVRNNLSTIMAMIHMQSDKLYNRFNEKLLESLERRIMAISLIQEQIYENRDLRNIKFASYVLQILDLSRNNSGCSKNIRYELDMPEELTFDMDTLISIGLIISETVSNSIKHAFAGNGGTISLHAHSKNSMINIRIKDSGPGFPEEITSEQSNGTNVYAKQTEDGIVLIRNLITQLRGTVLFYNSSGAVTEITFPY